MQFFGYFTLWQINTTVYSHIFLTAIKDLSSFEFLKHVFVQKLEVGCDDFGDIGEVSCSAHEIITGLERLGPCSVFENSSVLVWCLRGIPVILVLMLLLFIIGQYNTMMQRLYLKIRKRLYWNPFIRYGLESTLEL